MSKAVLLTGFEPFGEFVVNSSWEASHLVGQQMAARVLVRRLPVDYLPARAKLATYLMRHKPIICLCTGLGPEFAIERVARKPPQFSAIDGPDILEGAWPWSEIEDQVRNAVGSVRVSYDAGEYVCESTYWSLLAFRQHFGYPMYAAFLHVPPLSSGIPVELIATAVRNVIHMRLENTNALVHPKHRNPDSGTTPGSTRRTPPTAQSGGHGEKV
jgi:pyroglutamyl-peptidase